MVANFGAEGDRGQDFTGADFYCVINLCPEWGDEVGGGVVKGLDGGEKSKQIFAPIFLLGTPDFLTSFVDDSVEVGVSVSGSGTGGFFKEVREEGEVMEVRHQEGGLYGGGGDGMR